MIVVYSKDACPKCSQAIMLLKMKGVDHEVKKLDVDYSLEEIKAIAEGQREFPVIFNDEAKIGGLEQLKSYLK